ncbi:MAG: AMP-binding protein [Pseudohongiellaceae bacterium]
MYKAPELDNKPDLDPSRFPTVPALFDHIFSHWSDRVAFSCFGQELTYRELDEASAKLAAWLRENTDLKPGDRIAVQLPNVLQFPVAAVAALRAGLILVNTNPLYTAREMRHQFADSGARAVIIMANFGDKLEKVIADTDIKHVIVTEVGDMVPGLKGMLINAGARYIKKMVPRYKLPSAVRWKEVMSSSPGVDGREAVDAGTDVALILYTGGTTGLAKGAMLTHSNLIWNMMQLRSANESLIRDGEDVIIAPLPLYHTYAFMLHILSQCYAGNHNVLIPNPRDVDSLIKTIRETKPNGIVGINTLYLALCRHKEIEHIDFSAMRFSAAGGMALSSRVARDWKEITGSEVLEGYGLTECSPVVTVNPPGASRIGTVGKAVPSTSLMLADEEGNEVTGDEPGELWVKGPQVMKGYWQNEEATRESITEEGWFKTGDYAQFDEDDFVRIVDRKKDMINVSGFNVYPSEIEEVVNSHPGVAESAAIGIPDESSGEKIKLFVVRRDNVLTMDDVTAHCRENLTAYKVPRDIEFADDLPKTNVGKILRRELRDREVGKQEQS